VNKGPWHTRVIHLLASQWLCNGQLSISRRGNHAKIWSLLLHEDLKLNITEYLRANKFKITVHQFTKFVEEEAIAAFGIEGKKIICRKTARTWLHYLSWDYKDHSKSIFFDEHERDDIVAYWKCFLEQMASLRPQFL